MMASQDTPTPSPSTAPSPSATSFTDTSPSGGVVVETTALTLATGEPVHVRLSSSFLSITADGRTPLTYDVDDLVGCTSTQQSTGLALHFYPLTTASCLTRADPERRHEELQFHAPDLPTASLWITFFNRAARRLPIEKTAPPARNLLILINPASGTGDAAKKAAVVTPIFTRSALACNVTATTHAGHAHQIAQSMPLHTPTSIVCISGDGLLYEVINGLLSRPDWPDAVRTVTLGVIAGGSGNGLAKSITRLSAEPNSLIAQAFLVIKGYQRPLDISTIIQAGHAPVFSFVSLAWALISDIDFLSERWRWMGDIRFNLAAAMRLVFPQTHSARLSYLPVEDESPQHRGDSLHLTEGQRKSKRLLRQGGCSAHGQCEQCLKEGQEGEWREMKEYLEQRTLDVCEVERKDEVGRWKSLEAEFTLLWALNIPWVTKDLQAAPLAHFSDGCLDLLYVRRIGRLASLKLMMHFDTGEHILSRELDYCKVRAVRVEPEHGETCDLAVDGEHLPYAPLEMRHWRGILQVHSK